jgi:hypothetical protein
MSSRIDQLFKNKLSDHSLAPSEDAWAKVQNGLSKKSNVVIYWRAAAVFALIALLISAWYMLTRTIEIPMQQISKTENKEIQDSPVVPSVEEKESSATANPVSQPNNTTRRLIAKTEKPTEDKENETIKENKTEQVIENSPQTITIETEQALTIAEVKQEKPIVIEFTLPTITNSTTAEATLAQSETEKNTGIMKFLETARDVKNGEAEFGSSLRDFKNELFALDFKKDKIRRN